MNLYYVTAYHYDRSEWRTFVISAETYEGVIQRLKSKYADIQFKHVGPTLICSTPDNVFQEL